MKLNDLHSLTDNFKSTSKYPVLFIGHGSPMNAIENNIYTQKWKELGSDLPKPRAILCISAHWLTHGTWVTAMDKPRTIHDFGGFPEELFKQQYPAPGAPQLAEELSSLVAQPTIGMDYDWGLDHGTWSVLLPMYPDAEIPVYQLSIDYYQPLEYHYNLAKQLKSLRDKGILIIGSGNIVHNLRALRYDHKLYDWTQEFDSHIAQWVEEGNDQAIIQFQKLGKVAEMAHPTYDHFIPLLYTIGLKDDKDNFSFFNESFEYGALSMRSIIYA